MAVMAQPWKHLQNGIYFFRGEVPQDIRPIIGKREWKVSLRSKDLVQVLHLFAAESLRCEEMFVATRDQQVGRARVLSSDGFIHALFGGEQEYQRANTVTGT